MQKVLSKHKTFAAHFILFSGTQFGKHCFKAVLPNLFQLATHLHKIFCGVLYQMLR